MWDRDSVSLSFCFIVGYFVQYRSPCLQSGQFISLIKFYMYLQTTTYLKNSLPTNKSVISRLLWAAGYVGHCACEVHLSCERLLLGSNGGLKSITERSTTLTFKARITVPDCISYLKLLPWYIMNKAESRPAVILLTSLFAKLKFVPVSDLILLCWLGFSPCRHNALHAFNPTHKLKNYTHLHTNTHTPQVKNTPWYVSVIYRVQS